MARPVKRFTTTRSVVADWASDPEKPSAARLSQKRLVQKKLAQTRRAGEAIKAIPGRKPVRGRRPFLSCRCAVIVDADNIRVGGTLGATLKPCLLASG